MFAIKAGSYMYTICLITMGTIILTIVNRTQKGSFVPKIRRLAGLDAIDEAIGRATEMGRPIHFSPGVHDITAQTAPQTFAGLEVLGHVSQLAAEYNTPLICTIMRPNVYPLASEVVRQGYIKTGRPELFNERTVRYLGNHDQAYAYGVYGLMRREKPAANIMIGGFDGTAVGLAESGAAAGCIQVAGTAQLPQIPFFVASCDYTLIGEEIYAAGAYLAKDKGKIGTIVAQDIIKAITIAILLIGSLSTTFNWNGIVNFLSM